RDKTSYTAKEPNNDIRAFRDEAVEAIGKLNLVDVRSPDEFSGKLLAPAHLPQEQSQRAGHIPTAANIPWSKAANDDGSFRSDDELRQLYESAGIDPSKETIAYCRIGERSAHTWFVLHELLGNPYVRDRALPLLRGPGVLDAARPGPGRRPGRPPGRRPAGCRRRGRDHPLTRESWVARPTPHHDRDLRPGTSRNGRYRAVDGNHPR